MLGDIEPNKTKHSLCPIVLTIQFQASAKAQGQKNTDVFKEQREAILASVYKGENWSGAGPTSRASKTMV